VNCEHFLVNCEQTTVRLYVYSEQEDPLQTAHLYVYSEQEEDPRQTVHNYGIFPGGLRYFDL
jgi:murein tripeptide amidase MpaA